MKKKMFKTRSFNKNDLQQTDESPVPDFPPEVYERVVKNVMAAIRMIGPLRKDSSKRNNAAG